MHVTNADTNAESPESVCNWGGPQFCALFICVQVILMILICIPDVYIAV